MQDSQDPGLGLLLGPSVQMLMASASHMAKPKDKGWERGTLPWLGYRHRKGRTRLIMQSTTTWAMTTGTDCCGTMKEPGGGGLVAVVGALGQASRRPQVSAGINYVKFLGLGKAGAPCRVCVGAGFWLWDLCVPMAMLTPASRGCLGTTMTTFFMALACCMEGSPGLSCSCSEKGRPFSLAQASPPSKLWA